MTRRATATEPGEAWCRMCGRPDAPTRLDPRGTEVYSIHRRKGSEVTCYESMSVPVDPPGGGQR